MDLKIDIKDLLCRQYRHDLLCHQDILELNYHDVVKHVSLHFAKYLFELAELIGRDYNEKSDLLHCRMIVCCLVFYNKYNSHYCAFPHLEKPIKSVPYISNPAGTLGGSFDIGRRICKNAEDIDHNNFDEDVFCDDVTTLFLKSLQTLNISDEKQLDVLLEQLIYQPLEEKFNDK